MILSIYLTLLFLAVIAVGIGITTKEPYFTFVGLFFLFNLGIIVFTGSLEIPTGEDITTTYAYNNGTLDNATTTVNDTYTSFDKTAAHWYGFLLSFVSGIGAFVLFWNLKNAYQKAKEAEK